MKLLVSVAIFIFYLNSENTALKCYECYDLIPGGLHCDHEYERTCHLPPDAEFCFTYFQSSNKSVDHLDCGKEYCEYKSCNFIPSDEDKHFCNSTKSDIKTDGNETWGYSCCKGDLCNKLNATELLKLSSSAQSLNNNNFHFASVLYFLSSLFVLN